MQALNPAYGRVIVTGHFIQPEEQPEKDWYGQYQDVRHRLELVLGHFKLFFHNPIFFCIHFLDLFLILRRVDASRYSAWNSFILSWVSVIFS